MKHDGEKSILRGFFSSCKYLREFYEKCRATSGKQFSTALGGKFTVTFSDRFGDPRYYFVADDPQTQPPLCCDFVSECEIEKFADCFPATEPKNEADLRRAYSLSTPCGTMLPRHFVINYDKNYLSILYGFLLAAARL